MLNFLKIRIKAVKESFRRKRFLKFNNMIGLNPPMIVNGRRVFNPSFILLYDYYVKEQYKNIESVKKLRRIVNGEESGNKREAQIALALETKEGREALVKALLLPLKN